MKKCLMVLASVVLAVPLFAQEADQPPPIVEAARNQVAKFLRLTDEQVAAWDAIYQVHRNAERPIQEDLRAVQEEIDALFEAGDPDAAALGELVIERHALGDMLLEVHVVYHEDFVALLDDDQVRRLGFIARADDVEQIIPAFKLFELVPRR